jgi:AmmeMemoRadiSam system protein B
MDTIFVFIRIIMFFNNPTLRFLTVVLAAQNSACGRYPIAVLLDLARRHHWQPVLLDCANSGDTAGDPRQVVG